MNKWIIFIIIVGVISVIGVLAKFITSPRSQYSAAILEETVSQEKNPTIQFTNTSEYTVFPGALVLHNNNFSMNFLGIEAPRAYESLAEVGDPSEVISSLQGNPSVIELFTVEAIAPGETQQITIPRSIIDKKEYQSGTNAIVISYMAMIAETNDGVVWLNSHPLYSVESGGLPQGGVVTEVIDMGTEENAPIGSGFESGQPDLSQGSANRNNGTATTEPVRHHPQFYEDDAVSSGIVEVNLRL